MSLADAIQQALQQLNQAQAQVMRSFGGKPPAEVTEPFQKFQASMAGDNHWARRLASEMAEAEEKLLSPLQENDGAAKRPHDNIDCDAYAWQFQRLHGAKEQEINALVQSLLAVVEIPPRISTAPHSRPPQEMNCAVELPEWDSLDLPLGLPSLD
jgi:hypothetical protein